MLSTRLKTYVCTHEKLLDSENPLCAYARACYVRKHIINTFNKWICVLSVFIAIIPTYLLCQILANPPEVEFQGTISGAHHIQVQKAEIKFRRCLFPLSTKHEIKHFHVVVVQKRQRNVQKIVWFINCFIISSNNS